MDASLTMFLYTLFLTLHNITRWLVLAAAVFALVRAYRGWFGKSAWQRADDRAGIILTSTLDTQVLLGLVLYFLFSPFSQQIFANFSAAMKNPVNAYFGMEHEVGMIIAVVIAHAVRGMSRKAKNAAARQRTAAIGYSLSILVVLASIPWPFLQYGRPLLRIFGIIL